MSSDRDLRNAVEFLPGRLYYVALPSIPIAHPQKHFFSIDNELVYWNFFLDFGPLNLGQTYRFCSMLNSKLADSRLKDKVIYYYSGTHPHRRANAAFLICAWCVLCLDKSADEAYRPFKAAATPFPPWHDATPTICTYNLTVLDTLRGLQKARECNFFDWANFNIEEYEYFEKVENGDLNWSLDGKFIMFAGPHASRETGPGGYQTLCPDDYIPYFKRKNVTLVVRLNKKYYDARRFTSQGIDHADLYFLDGSNPPDNILYKFIQLCEETPGAVAVHCKAGLGRTGCCIGAYMMKHYRFTAEELIGWLRIVRPGSIIGPQQQFMKEIQARMWRDGEVARARLTSIPSTRVAIEDEAGTETVLRIGGAGASASATAASASDSSQSLSAKMSGLSVKTGSRTAMAYEPKERGSAITLGGGRAAGGASMKETDAGETQGDSLRARRQQMKDAADTAGMVPKSSSRTVATGGNAAADGAASPGSPGGNRRSTLGTFLSSWGK